MRRKALIGAVAAALFGCTEAPTAPSHPLPQFDVAPGAEILALTGPIQATGDFAQFTSATGAVLLTDHTAQANLSWDGSWWRADPYTPNGLSIRKLNSQGWGRAVVNEKTPLLAGREMTFDADEGFAVSWRRPMDHFGIWILDNTLISISGTGKVGTDSRWTVTLLNASGQTVGSLRVDPPVNQAYFLGVTSDVPFTQIRFWEEPINGSYTPTYENDFFGSIYMNETVPQIVVPTAWVEGSPLPIGITDADGDELTTACFQLDWEWGEYVQFDCANPPTFADDMEVDLYITVDDGFVQLQKGFWVWIANVAPVVTSVGDAELFPGETWSAAGTFTDPGADTWSATVDFGDGTSMPIDLDGKAWSVEHVYAMPGTYHVDVAVTDDDGGAGHGTGTIHVLSPAQGGEVLRTLMKDYVSAGALDAREAKALEESVTGVVAALAKGDKQAALGKLGAFENKLNALLNSGRIRPAAHASLTDYAKRLRKAIGG
jgi:hypothetical protein